MKGDDLLKFLLLGCGSVIANATKIDLYEEAISNREAALSTHGQVCVSTGAFTGRAADDKYIVNNVDDVEFGPAGKKLSQDAFDKLLSRTSAYLRGRKVYVNDFVVNDNLKVRLIAEFAWHALFATNLLRSLPEAQETVQLTIVAVPGLTSGGEFCGFRSDTAVACDFKDGVVIIAGTSYAGEIKKSVFTYASYVSPHNFELPMHSSVTTDLEGDNPAVFFGLSGTGKTTLSADPHRILLGDDEHIWTKEGVYNIEGGCYAKVINLTKESEPGIWCACHEFGTVLENVVMNEERELDFSSNHLTENTRAAYPLGKIHPSHKPGTIVGHPKNIIMLTCDAYGILPSVSKLSPEAAVYHFLSGYTAKIAGTEAGIKEPKVTFSRCFGAPFMPHEASTYANLFHNKLTTFAPNVWLVNTGWVDGPYGVGKRISLDVTRHIIDSILDGAFAHGEMRFDPLLNLHSPVKAPHSDPTWKEAPNVYESARAGLIEEFLKNNETLKGVSDNIINAGPRRA